MLANYTSTRKFSPPRIAAALCQRECEKLVQKTHSSVGHGARENMRLWALIARFNPSVLLLFGERVPKLIGLYFMIFTRVISGICK